MRHFKDDLTNTWFYLGIPFGVILICTIVFFVLFGEKIAFGGQTCAFYAVTHLYCPGCGGTRATYYFVKGQIIKSILFNPFVPYTILAYVVFMVNTVLVKTTKKLGFSKYPASVTIYVGVGILILQWIIRNTIYIAFGITCL